MKRLFFTDIFAHTHVVEVLDTSTMPFAHLQTITLGISFVSGLTFLGGVRDILVFTSYEKRSIRAINCHDGREEWTVGPLVLERECQPIALCRIGNGKPSSKFPRNYTFRKKGSVSFLSGQLETGRHQNIFMNLVCNKCQYDRHILAGNEKTFDGNCLIRIINKKRENDPVSVE